MSTHAHPLCAPLLHDRHLTADFLICDVFDAIPKDDMASMENPIFLSTRPHQSFPSYENNGASVENMPLVKEFATIHDKGARNLGTDIHNDVRILALQIRSALIGIGMARHVGRYRSPRCATRTRSSWRYVGGGRKSSRWGQGIWRRFGHQAICRVNRSESGAGGVGDAIT